MKRSIAILLALLLAGTGAMAMPFRTTSDPVTVAVTDLESAEEARLELSEFQLLGTDEAGNYILFADGRYYSAVPASMPLNGIDALPALADYETLAKGSRNDAAKQLQQALIDLEYLTGTADGDYGKKTESAVSAFQAALGFEETGAAEPLLQLLAYSMTQPELEFSPEDFVPPYLALSDQLGIDFQGIVDSGLTVNYDDIAGEVFITDGAAHKFDQSGGADIDKYVLTVQFGLTLTILDDGSVEKKPVIKLSCMCLQRPVISDVILKSGTVRGTAEIEDIATSLDGIQILETGTVTMNEQMLEVLSGAEDNGELKLRVNGRYKSFDVKVKAERLSALSKIGRLAKEL